MRSFWQVLRKTLFWSYERGTWPYDLMVVAILIFVLLTPRSWFHDQPQAVAQLGTAIHLLAGNASSRTQTYRVASFLLPVAKRAQKPTPELEREMHEILGRSVGELKGRVFQIQSIEPVVANDGHIEYYEVEVKPSPHQP